MKWRWLVRLIVCVAALAAASPASAGYTLDDIVRASMKGMPEDTVVLMTGGYTGGPIDSATAVQLLRAGVAEAVVRGLTEGAHPTAEELVEAQGPGPAYTIDNAPERREKVADVPRLRNEGCPELFPLRTGPQGYNEARWGMSRSEVLESMPDHTFATYPQGFGPIADDADFVSYPDRVAGLDAQILYRLDKLADCHVPVLTGVRVKFADIDYDTVLKMARALQGLYGDSDRQEPEGHKIIWYRWSWEGISLYWHNESGHMSLTYSSTVGLDLFDVPPRDR